MPEFSVVIPCRDAAATLPAALASLRAQTCNDWEAICIDDGSCDDTAEVIRRVARMDRRVRQVTVAPGGPGQARNIGVLAHARGRLIAFLDADDLWRPGKLAEVSAVFAAPAAPDAVFGRTLAFGHDPAQARAEPGAARRQAWMLDAETVLTVNPVATMSNLTVRRDVFKRTGGFDVRLTRAEDLEWLIRLVASGAVIQALPRVHVLRRRSGVSSVKDLLARRNGWQSAVEAARIFDIAPCSDRLARAEAIHLRNLAAQSLTIDGPRGMALGYAALGLLRSPAGFLSDLPGAARTMALSAAAALSRRGPRRASTAVKRKSGGINLPFGHLAQSARDISSSGRI